MGQINTNTEIYNYSRAENSKYCNSYIILYMDKRLNVYIKRTYTTPNQMQRNFVKSQTKTNF